jgi:hypothetical protein
VSLFTLHLAGLALALPPANPCRSPESIHAAHLENLERRGLEVLDQRNAWKVLDWQVNGSAVVSFDEDFWRFLKTSYENGGSGFPRRPLTALALETSLATERWVLGEPPFGLRPPAEAVAWALHQVPCTAVPDPGPVLQVQLTDEEHQARKAYVEAIEHALSEDEDTRRRAGKLYAQSCRAGFAPACARAARSIESDITRALLLRDACRGPSPDLCGWGARAMGKRDGKVGIELAGIGCDAGFGDACHQLGELLSTRANPDIEATVTAFRRACRSERNVHCNRYVEVVRRGLGSDADPADGPDLQAVLSDACEKRDAESCRTLAEALLDGTFGTRSLEKAREAGHGSCTYEKVRADNCWFTVQLWASTELIRRAMPGASTAEVDAAQNLEKALMYAKVGCRSDHTESCRMVELLSK